MWNILTRISGTESTIKNFNYCQIHQKINGFSKFIINLTQPSGWQLTEINGDTEIEITAGNHEQSGIIVNHKNNTGKNIKTLTGYDYTYKLKKIRINTDNLTYADASSSDFKVIYDSVAFKTISTDLLSSTGFTVGSIDTYPSIGPDTNISLLFEYATVLEGQKELSEIANDSNKTFEYWINKDKEWYMKNRRGSSTSVFDLNDGINFTINDWEGDSIRLAKRIIVVGNNDLKGVYPSSGFTPGDEEEVFYYPSNEQTILDELAHNLYESLNSEINWVKGACSDSNANIQIGDKVSLQSNKLGITATDYRIVELIKTMSGSNESLILILNIGDNNLRKKSLNELLTSNKGLRRYEGKSITGTGINTLTYDVEFNSNSTNKARLNFSLTSDNIGSATNILDARLIVKRTPLRYDTPNSTDNHAHGRGTIAASDHGHNYGTLKTDTHPHGSTGLTTTGAGGSSIVSSGNSSANETTSVGYVGASIDTYTTLQSFSLGSTALSGVICSVNVRHSGQAGSETVWLRLRATRSGYTTYDFTLPLTVLGAVEGDNAFTSGFLMLPQNLANYTIVLGAGWGSNITRNLNYTYNLFTLGTHTHPLSGSTDDATPGVNGSTGDTTPGMSGSADNNTASITPTINEPGGEAAHTVRSDINGTYRIEWTNTAVGDTQTSDVSTWVNALGNYTIDVYPTSGSGRYKITAEIDYFQTT